LPASSRLRLVGGLLTKYYLSKVVQRVTVKRGGTFLMSVANKSALNLTVGRYKAY